MYLKMQEAVWPSSLLPKLERFLSGNGATDLTPPVAEANYCPGCGATANPSLGPAEPSLCPQCSSEPTPELKDVVDRVIDQIHETNVTLSVIGVTPEPRGVKFARVDDSKPPVFDDIDSERAEGASLTSEMLEREVARLPTKQEPTFDVPDAPPRCDHCGKPNEKTLCSDCFMAGHRNGDCLRCAEQMQEKL